MQPAASLRVVAQRLAVRGIGLAEDRPRLAAKGDELAGFEPLKTADRAHVEFLLLPDQVEHLAADHAVHADRARQQRQQFDAHARVDVSDPSRHLEPLRPASQPREEEEHVALHVPAVDELHLVDDLGAVLVVREVVVT